MHDDSIVSLISFRGFCVGPFTPILNRLMALNTMKYLWCRGLEWQRDLNLLHGTQNDILNFK